MKAEFINPFIVAAFQVLKEEAGLGATRGSLTRLHDALQSGGVTVMIGVTGGVYGLVVYDMTEHTAKGLVSAIRRKPTPLFDSAEADVIAELANVITGLASGELEKVGYPCRITPPNVTAGKGTSVSVNALHRLVLVLETEVGPIAMHLALQAKQ